MFEEVVKELVTEYTKKMLEVCSDLGTKKFSETIVEVGDIIKSMGREVIEKAYWQADTVFYERRDKHSIVVQNSLKRRRILTVFGEVVLSRRLYREKSSGRYFFAMDEAVQLEKYSRIESGLKAKLIEGAALVSYGKASHFANDAVSRQTVFNIIKNLGFIEAPKKVNSGASVHIEADEDHVHLRPKNNAIMKIVYTHEGVRENQPGRRELVNPRYFVSIDDDADTIWNDVANFVEENYKFPPSSLNGDGAAWIRYGERVFPISKFRLDKFHTQRATMLAADGDKRRARKLRQMINQKDRDGLIKLYYETMSRKILVSKRRSIAKALAYLINNIYNIGCGYCSAEGHVSHVLSARLSSRPMAWSKAGAERIAKLRAYMYNGGKFEDLASAKSIHQNISEIKPIKCNSSCYAAPKTEKIASETYKISGFYGGKDEFQHQIRQIIKNL